MTVYCGVAFWLDWKVKCPSQAEVREVEERFCGASYKAHVGSEGRAEMSEGEDEA